MGGHVLFSDQFWRRTDGSPHSGCFCTVWTLQTPRSPRFVFLFVNWINVSSPNPKSFVVFSLSSAQVWRERDAPFTPEQATPVIVATWHRCRPFTCLSLWLFYMMWQSLAIQLPHSPARQKILYSNIHPVIVIWLSCVEIFYQLFNDFDVMCTGYSIWVMIDNLTRK